MIFDKKKSPLVSVIIPTYNRGWVLREAIDSVLAQDFKDFELIVIDDGSTDDTDLILSPYQNHIIVHKQANQGVSSARNTGISLSSGTFIAFLDSDDLWLPDKLSVQIDFFVSNPDTAICQTEEVWIRNGVRVNPKKKHKKPSGMIFEPSLHLCLVSPSAVMLRRWIFEAAGMFDENLPACEDYDLWLRIGCKYPVYLIETPHTVKRGGHADQLSISPGLDQYRIQSLVKLLNAKMLSRNQAAAAVKVLREKCDIFANGCMKRGRIGDAEFYRKLPEKYCGVLVEWHL